VARTEGSAALGLVESSDTVRYEARGDDEEQSPAQARRHHPIDAGWCVVEWGHDADCCRHL